MFDRDFLIAIAPYVSAIAMAITGFLTYRESKRKSKHDELHELYKEVKDERDKYKEENDELRKELDEK